MRHDFIQDQRTISIHAPTRGATPSRSLTMSPISISIHAPTRGATRLDFFAQNGFSISIHAPTRGATNTFDSYSWQLIEFQSTLPREERLRCKLKCSFNFTISIHAPTRGATAILHKKFVYFYTIPTINI